LPPKALARDALVTKRNCSPRSFSAAEAVRSLLFEAGTNDALALIETSSPRRSEEMCTPQYADDAAEDAARMCSMRAGRSATHVLLGSPPPPPPLGNVVTARATARPMATAQPERQPERKSRLERERQSRRERASRSSRRTGTSFCVVMPRRLSFVHRRERKRSAAVVSTPG
jgi:type IV secretory pathway VirB10-like protein